MSVPEFKISDRGPGLGGPIICRAQKFGANVWFSPDWPNHGPAGNDGAGASGRLPGAEAECPLSLQLGDLRADAGQRARSAQRAFNAQQAAPKLAVCWIPFSY